MTINTKFNVNDKVWIPVEENKYIWGKVLSINVEVKYGSVEVLYSIENRFYDTRVLFFSFRWEYERLENKRHLESTEKETFKTKEECVAFISDKFNQKIEGIGEIKKSLINL